MPHSATLDQTERIRREKFKSIGLWTLQVLVAINFLFAGGGKLAGMEPMVEVFEAVGIGQWFRIVTGALEVGGAVLLLIPSLAAVGALVLSGVMVGAILTELIILSGSPLIPAILLLMLVAISYGRRDHLPLRTATMGRSETAVHTR